MLPLDSLGESRLPILTGEQLEELFLLLGLVTLVQNQTDAGGVFVWGLEERKGFQGCHSDSKVARTPVSPSSSLVSCTFVSQSLFPQLDARPGWISLSLSLSCRGESFLFAQ